MVNPVKLNFEQKFKDDCFICPVVLQRPAEW